MWDQFHAVKTHTSSQYGHKLTSKLSWCLHWPTKTCLQITNQGPSVQWSGITFKHLCGLLKKNYLQGAADEPVVAERPVVFHSGILHRTMKLLYGLWHKDWRDIVFDAT